MSGTSDKIKGRVKEAVGALTDNHRLKDEGKLLRVSNSKSSPPTVSWARPWPARLPYNGGYNRKPQCFATNSSVYSSSHCNRRAKRNF